MGDVIELISVYLKDSAEKLEDIHSSFWVYRLSEYNEKVENVRE
ncbi:hypothetical protein HH1059_13840 [Halorhodospira halochloris]|uniref:Uncharacterized protein n=1 Tax=Halorhodospira halochloris TaxID=1052 RepID=A0A2Z6EZI4_HALHR|nr:hypothetical protein [Halorhodospira halochloris]BBE11067.1 hypothetical protein HH1059_13840 [Halorhodospira halochloris]